MYVSWRWISEYVDTTGVDPHSFAERFTLSVAEIEEVVDFGLGLDGVRVVDVKAVAPHPDADKLRLATLLTGAGEVTVVCGAPDLAVGMRAVWAPPGVTLPSGIAVRDGEIRGVPSPGMLCSERDLGLSDEHAGLLDLHGCTAPAGTPLPEAVALTDTLFEIDNKSITHRPDLWGHHGVAREVAALLSRPLRPLDTEGLQFGDADPVRLQVQPDSGCSRYLCARVADVVIAPSPIDLRLRLRAVGVRPISNAVDATNLVMLETGNPLHAFDARHVRGGAIEVRSARDQETLTTLDGQPRALLPNDCVIADAEGPVALAGIMGGLDSEIRDDTTEVILEAASFDGAAIRRTATRLGMRTESSARFEKSLDPQTARHGALRFLKLLQQLCPTARIVSRLADQGHFPAAPPAPVHIHTSATYLRARLGVDADEMSDAWMDRTLGSLGFAARRDGDQLDVIVPSFRAGRDVGIAEDLVEELGRIYGYDHIRSTPPDVPARPPHLPPLKKLQRAVRASLVLDARLTEVMLYSFDFEPFRERCGLVERGPGGDPLPRLRLKNAISAEATQLRRSLAPGILAAMERNLERGTRAGEGAKGLRVGLFELGRVFVPVTDAERAHPAIDPGVPQVLLGPEREAYLGQMDAALAEGAEAARLGATPLPWQPTRLCVAVGERLGGGAAALTPPAELTRDLFGEVVGAIESLVADLGLPPLSLRAMSRPGQAQAGAVRIPGAVDLDTSWVHPARHAEIVCGGQHLGLVTMIHPELRRRLQVPVELALAEIDLDALLAVSALVVVGREPPRFPATSFDITVRARSRVRAEDLRACIETAARAHAGDDLESARFVAVYEDPHAADHPRALTFRVTCRRDEGTLSERDLQGVEAAVIEGLQALAALDTDPDGRAAIDLAGRGGAA